MSALSNVRDTPVRTADMREAVLAATIRVYKGALVVRDTATGYDKPGVTGTGLVVRGIADMSEPYVDTTGVAAGSRRIQLLIGVALLANDGSIAAANRGASCFIVDDQTVALTDGSATRSVAGTIEDVDSRGVWVRVGSVDGTALATEIASRQAITTNLASTANAKGASLVGIEDSAGKITATTVEGALAEGIDARRVATSAGTGIGLIPVVIQLPVVDGAGTTNTDLALDATFGKITVIAARFVKTGSTGGASDTVQLANGATTNYITDALALSTKAANAVVEAAVMAQTYVTLAAGATLRSVNVHSTTSVAGTWFITALRAA
jgi:hypothetical protein